MLAAMRALLGDNVNKFVRDRNYLEGVLAAAALVSYADGNVSEEEEAAIIKAIQANATLSKAWSAKEIALVAQNMLDRAGGGRMGQAGLYSEIEDIAKNPDMAEAVLLMALDVAESNGEVDPKEKAILEKIASRLSLNLSKYL